ncbi:phosphoribosylamine--glycine ligase [Virgibacillus sp. NKC19-3]|uniref:phosphoribosylamine--glycine ligase n=1 Tax=Virgibacillus saliphilus TaxID=2831674 RepID=UPI001C9AD66B|nr:phosphoribosylamine--glycine ligase [Virgibacillus sp. NKC19-3]MBY7142672.1 phosphoribosylamine--glycine ligase [Virgibacillus sp. NKC19-3]
MNILVVGRGGREHSIVMKLAEDNMVTRIYVAPGNGGIAEQATCVPIDEMDVEGLVNFAKRNAIDLTIVGPEDPLNAGIANRFQEEGLKIFAPTREAALLEGSKSFAKAFMKKYEIPTADANTFTNAEEAKQYIDSKGAPIVVKADGLVAGKGVIVAETKDQAYQAVDEMLVAKHFAEAGTTIVIEEFLAGNEFTLMAFVHEKNVFPMIPARDHKRVFDNDEGPNTGGMGAYAPVADVSNEHLIFAKEEILQKAVEGLMKEGQPFMGILYAGLIMTEEGPKVIEFNTRFGDPETQVVLPLLKNDLAQVLVDVMDGHNPQLKWEEGCSVGVVVASEGYPDAYRKGVRIPEISSVDDAFTIHGGTKSEGGSLVSNGGRVLLVGAKDDSLEKAADTVYEALALIDDMKGFFYRRDIGRN